MRILIITPKQFGIGGIAQHVQNLSNFLKKKGHEVDIISSENTFTIPIRRLKNPSFMISAFLKTKFKKGYDIVHAQNIPSALAMRNVSGKKVLSLWGMYAEQIELLHGKTAGKLSDKFQRNALEWADAITVSSKEMYEHYTKLSYQVHYIPNAIDLNSLPAKEDRLYNKQVIYAGRLSKEKGILDVIKMAEELPEDVHLIILGSGPDEDKVRETAKKKPNIHYLGYQPKEKTIQLIRGSDILIQPSLMEGGISTTLLEAMGCKIPIIITSIDVNNETFHHMKTAFLVKPNSPSEILKGILDLISDSKKRVELAENAYKIAQEHDWGSVGEKYLEIYRNLCDYKTS